MIVLELDNVSRTYSHGGQSVPALQDVSLSVSAGEWVAVCGPSGCGKTTLLLTAGTLLSPCAGTVRVNACDVYGLTPERRAAFRAAQVGFVFQQFHLLPYLTVRDNVRAASLATGNRAEARQADELLERFGLVHRASHRPAQLSTGERQRTALARALLNRPPLLLADEPTGNLDPVNSRMVLDQLAEYARQGNAVLLVTHQSAAAARADRTIYLSEGRL